MVTGNENTIKLIYAIEDITLMMILNIYGIWNNGHNRTFRRYYPDDDNGEVFASGNVPCMIEGKGNCMIIGDEDALVHCKTFGDGPL